MWNTITSYFCIETSSLGLSYRSIFYQIQKARLYFYCLKYRPKFSKIMFRSCRVGKLLLGYQIKHIWAKWFFPFYCWKVFAMIPNKTYLTKWLFPFYYRMLPHSALTTKSRKFATDNDLFYKTNGRLFKSEIIADILTDFKDGRTVGWNEITITNECRWIIPSQWNISSVTFGPKVKP